MENKSHALAAGLFVVILTALVIALSLWMGRDTTVYKYYELATRGSVSGLSLQAAVRYKGVPVGKVTGIEFDPSRDGTVLITIAVNAEAPLSQATYAQLGFQGVTGLAHIQLDNDGSITAPLPPGPRHLPRLPMRPSPVGQLAEQGPQLVQQVQEAARRLNNLLADDNQRALVGAVQNIGQAAQSIDALSRRLQTSIDTRLDPALAALPAVAQDTRRAITSIERTTGEVGKAVAGLVGPGGAVEHLSAAADQVGGAADRFNRSTLPSLTRAMGDIGSAARRMGDAADTFRDNPQSLLFGPANALPGPGESGFTAPTQQQE